MRIIDGGPSPCWLSAIIQKNILSLFAHSQLISNYPFRIVSTPIGVEQAFNAVSDVANVQRKSSTRKQNSLPAELDKILRRP